MVHVLGKRWLFLIGNGAEIQPLEMVGNSLSTFILCVCEKESLWLDCTSI